MGSQIQNVFIFLVENKIKIMENIREGMRELFIQFRGSKRLLINIVNTWFSFWVLICSFTAVWHISFGFVSDTAHYSYSQIVDIHCSKSIKTYTTSICLPAVGYYVDVMAIGVIGENVKLELYKLMKFITKCYFCG